MIWILNNKTATIEAITLEQFIERFNNEKDFSSTYKIQSIQYEYPHNKEK